MEARVIALANQKGGVGKTTTAVSLAVALGRRSQRVLLVDLDPQANATGALGQSSRDGLSTYDALLEEVLARDCVVHLQEEGIDLLPSSRDLAGAEVNLVPLMARERRLAAALVPLRAAYDLVLVDCPPSLGLLTINALAAADQVLIPVQCEYLALEGLSRLVETLDLVGRNLNSRLNILGLVMTMFDSRTRLSQQVVDEVRRHFPQTFDTVIPRSVRLAEAPSYGQSIFRYHEGGRAAEAYRQLAEEVLARVGVPV